MTTVDNSVPVSQQLSSVKCKRIHNIAMMENRDSQQTIRYLMLQRSEIQIIYNVRTYYVHMHVAYSANITPSSTRDGCGLWLWRGSVDTHSHLCVQDAQLPCQDA